MKVHKPIYQIALPVPLRRLFDYWGPDSGEMLQRGSRVKVPFGKKVLTGIVINTCEESTIPQEQLKSIQTVCDPFAVFSPKLCDLIEKTARYYHHPIGEVAFTGAPLALRQGKSLRLPTSSAAPEKNAFKGFDLNAEQNFALEAILASSSSFKPFLLEGITGSGKTEVYLQAAENILQQNKQVLILVPEISLTPQTHQRFEERFGSQVGSYHSKMSPAARMKTWLKVFQGQTSVVIGTRSAIFLPFPALGLIVIDEEHDPSFKQQTGFRYSARDTALMRAQIENCPIILGSATPAFESILNAKMGKYQHLILSQRANTTFLPKITQLDIRHKKLEAGLSPAMIQSIESHLNANGQVLLFINRRGYAPTFMCYDCGWIAQCDRCDTRLTLHAKANALICHHCLHQRAKPRCCPSCQQSALNPVGYGTERLEEMLQARFPHATLARIDSDATRKKGHLEELLQVAQNKEAQILIGTQILAKGHHFPHLTLVAIVDVDGGLFSVDFRAVERMAQLIIQVAGRAGRVHHAGEVMIQTLHPDNPLLQQILKQDYPQFADTVLSEREQCQLPPYSHLALIRAEATNPQLPENLLKEIQASLFDRNIANVRILGPVCAPMQKKQGHFRYQLLLQSQQRQPLHQILSYLTSILEKSKLAKRVRWSLDVDPLEML